YILEVYIRQVNEHSLVGLEVAWRRPLIPLVLNGKGCPTDTIVVHIGRVSSIATGRHRVRFGYDPLVDAIAPGVQPNIERKARKNPPFDLNPTVPGSDSIFLPERAKAYARRRRTSRRYA